MRMIPDIIKPKYKENINWKNDFQKDFVWVVVVQILINIV